MTKEEKSFHLYFGHLTDQNGKRVKPEEIVDWFRRKDKPNMIQAADFASVFEWLHEWGLKPADNIRFAGKWKDGVGNHYSVAELYNYFQKDKESQNKGAEK